MVINQWNITLFIQQKNWMQRARHDFISGKPDVSDSTWMWQRSALAQRRGVHRFVNFVDYYFELFFDAETNGPLSMYWLNRSIVHAIRMHVSEVQCSGAVRAHTICVPRQSPNEPHSGPPLTTKPGPAKQTASERVTEWSLYSNEQGFGAQTRLGDVSKHPVWVNL